jgi:glutathione peroxidase
MSKNIYDIPINSWDGQENILEKYKGKVTLITNVITDCGNAPEYGILQDIYEKYRDQGFEILAVPTNEYCGEFIVYDEFVDGINCALDAKKFAEETYNVTYNFSELVKSNPGVVEDRVSEILYPSRPNEFPRQLPEGESPHELFKTLCCDTSPEDPNKGKMLGNFEKFLIDREGNFFSRHHNGSLMPRYDENEYADKYGIALNNRRTHDHVERSEVSDDHFSGVKNYEKLCRDIEQLLNN